MNSIKTSSLFDLFQSFRDLVFEKQIKNTEMQKKTFFDPKSNTHKIILSIFSIFSSSMAVLAA